MNEYAMIFIISLKSSDFTEIRSGARRSGPGRSRASGGARRILDAARESFGRLGFAGATVETIASEAGVSNGLLYQFFRGKEHLFEVVLGELVRDWARAMAAGEREASARARSRGRCSAAPSTFARGNPLLPALLTEDAQLQLARFRHRSADRVAAPPRAGGAHPAPGHRGRRVPRRTSTCPRVADLVCQLQVDYSARAYRRDPLHPVDPALIDAAVRFIADAVRS